MSRWAKRSPRLAILASIHNKKRDVYHAEQIEQDFARRGTFCGLWLLAAVALVPAASDVSGQACGAAKTKGGAVTLLNCTGRAVTVKAYNADDAKMVLPTQTNAIASGLKMKLNCATKHCKLVFNLSRRLVATPQANYAILKNGARDGCGQANGRQGLQVAGRRAGTTR